MFDCLTEAHGHEVYESGLFIALATEYVCRRVTPCTSDVSRLASEVAYTTAVCHHKSPSQTSPAFHLQPVEMGLPLQKFLMCVLNWVRFVTSKHMYIP